MPAREEPKGSSRPKKSRHKVNTKLDKKTTMSHIRALQTQRAYQFFSDNQFCRKFCAKFYPSSENPKVCSGCNFEQAEHVEVSAPLSRWASESLIWKKDFHLVNQPYPSKTLKIRIVDEPSGIDKTANLVILADNAHPSMSVKVLIEQWKIAVPDFIVSVIGTSHEFPVTPEQFKTLKPDFMKAVSTSNTWIIGGGSLHGVDKLVSECVKDLQLQAWMGLSSKKFQFLGIVNWDCFESSYAANKFYFGTEDPITKFNYTESFDYFVKKRKPEYDDKRQRLSFSLNPYFTNFIAIQGGIKGKLHQETTTRTAIENLLSNPLMEKSFREDLASIPATVLALGGDCGTLEHIALSLANGIPVVLCQGSGGVTDIIIGALRMSKNQGDLVEYQKNAITRRIRGIINLPMDENQLFAADYMDAATHLRNISVCVQLRSMITVYRLDKPVIGSKLDQCILRSLLCGKAVSQYDPVFLGLKWGKCEKAIRDRLLSEGDINFRHNIRTLCRTAILQDQTEFIELFLALDLDLCKYLTVNELEELYKESEKSEFYLKKLFRPKKTFGLKDVYNVIFWSSSAYENIDLKHLESSLANSSYGATQELFWWSVFNNRLTLSKFLWKNTQNQMANALIAAALCRTCQSYIPESETFHLQQFSKMQETYEKYASILLDEVWDFNERFAKELLLLKSSSLMQTSVFEIAQFTCFKDFISHVGVQICVEEKWKSGLKYSLFRLFFSIFMPFRAIRDVEIAQLESRSAWDGPTVDVTPLNAANYENAKLLLAETYTTSSLCDSNNKHTSSPNSSYSLEDLSLTQDQIPPSKCGNKTQSFPLLEGLVIFYTTPAVKFTIHLAFFLFFLAIYSHFLLKKTTNCPPSSAEKLVFLFNSCYLLEAFILISHFKGPLSLKLLFWIRCEWSYIQAVSSSFGVAAFLLRLFCYLIPYWSFGYAPAFYAISGFLVWVRLLAFYRCSRRLGPLWILIRKMMRETLGYMVIFSTISIAAGICIQVLMNTYEYEDMFSGELQWLFLRPFFMFTGENFLRTVGSKVVEENEQFIMIYSVVYILYFLLGNALMLNLLVAIFSEIFNKVFVRSDCEFKNEFLMLTKEYTHKTTLPVPFLLIELFYKLSRFCLRKIWYSCVGHGKRSSVASDERNVIAYFESQCCKRMLVGMDQNLSCKETVKYALRSLDEQQGRLADMKILFQEVERQVGERFLQERIKKYSSR